MKVALIIEHFDATRGAAEHLAVWVANALAKGGHEVHVVCHDVTSRINRYRQATQRASHDAELSYRAHPPAEVAHEGIHIHRLGGMRVNTGFGFRRFGARARQWCRVNKPDVVHSLTVAFPGDLYHACGGVYAAMQAQAAAIRTSAPGDAAAGRGGAGGGGGEGAWRQMLTRLTGRQRTLLALERRAALAAGGGGRAGGGGDKTGGPRRIVSLCPMMTEQFRRFYGVDGGRITELASPHMQIAGRGPWDADWSAEARGWFRGNYRIGPDERVALFVGHDFRRKGLRYAIEAIAKTQTRWKLLVVGLGKAREYVELADLLGIGDRDEPARGGRGGARVLFVGPTREMERVYAAADALLLPTFYDPFGLVATEALAHGLPVVSTAFLGPGDLVRRHGVGTIVPDPRAVAEMAAALDGLPAPGSAAAAALAGRARAASAGVTPDEYLRALIGLYESVRGRR